MTEDEVLDLVADTLNMDREQLGDDMEYDHTEWDSVDVMTLLGVFRREGVVVVIPDHWRAIHTLGGILGLFREQDRLN